MFNPDLLFGGLALAMSLKALLLVLVGTLLGVFIGAIPGLGPLIGIILLLPVKDCRCFDLISYID